ncbi:MAG: TonB family protein [Deltaproteobacteria bacterium]|nr:TonB family protein [Deltaproteobacteria bacterium]
MFDKNHDLAIWVAISLVLHLLLIGIFSTINSRSAVKREFYAPTYKVDLVTLDRPKPAPNQKKKVTTKKSPLPPPSKKVAKKSKKQAKPIKKAKTKKLPKKKVKTPVTDPSAMIKKLRKKHEEEMAVEEKLARVRSKVAQTRKAAQTAGQVSTTPKAGVRKVDTSNMKKEIKAYSDLLYEKMENAWILPGSADYSGLSAIISVTIGKNGELLKVDIEEGSGNGFFDQSVMRAVEKSVPFPRPPKGYEGGIEIGFRFGK